MSEINSMNDVTFAKNVRVREIVEGQVVEVKENFVLVDLQQFTEGTMYLDHYTTDSSVTDFRKVVKVGDMISGEVTKVSEELGIILLSRLSQLRNEKFTQLAKQLEETEVIEVVVKKKNASGYSVNYQGFEFFMPNSQSGDEVVIGNTYKVKILEVKPARKSAVVSKRQIDNAEYYEQKNKELDKINVGDVLKGTVARIENYGALVKFDLVQGLLRITELSHTFVKQIKDVVKEGETIEVKVIKKTDGKIELSKKALIQPPYVAYAEKNPVGSKVTGKVVEKLPFGIVLELDKNITGLLHQTEFDFNPRSNFASNLKLKEEVEVSIIAMDTNKQRISLSRKPLLENPWADVNITEGQEIEVTVTNVTPKGLTINASNVTGFIPVREITFEGKSNKLDDYYKVGDTVKGIVTTFNKNEWSLEVSVRKFASNTERKQFETYLEKQEEQNKDSNLGEVFKDILK